MPWILLPLLAAATPAIFAASAQSGLTGIPDCPGSALCPSIVAPDNSNPEHDARGIPVISAPASAPAGYNQPPQTVPAGTPVPTVAAPTPTSAGQPPPCTRTVTDRCIQTYERGRRR